MLPEKKTLYPEFAGQAVALPALLELIDTGLTAPEMHRVLHWMGRWDLLWIGTDDTAEPVPNGETTLAEIEAQARFDRICAEVERAQTVRGDVEIKIVPLSPGGCPAARELAEGTPASEGPSCGCGQDGEGGGVIPSPPPEPEDDTPEEDDEDETDPAAPPPPCAADAGAPLPVIEGAPTPAETAPEAVQAGDRNGQPWTPEEDALALSLRSKGVPVTEIAARLGRPYWATQGRFKKLAKKSEKLGGERGGLQRLDPAEHDPVQGTTAEDAAPPVVPEAAPVDRPVWWVAVELMLDTIGTKGGWSAARDLVLVDGRAKGLIWSLICDELGVEVRDAKARLVALTPDGGGEAELRRLTQVLRDRAARDGAQ